jgi:hypothetical protein
MKKVNYTNILEETRKMYTKSILREQVSKKLTETFLHIESKLDRELTTDEIENILIFLTDEINN